MVSRSATRRGPGEGSVWEYRTRAGQIRYAIGLSPLRRTAARAASPGAAGRMARSGRRTGMPQRHCARRSERRMKASGPTRPSRRPAPIWTSGRRGAATLADHGPDRRALPPAGGHGRRHHKGELTGQPLSARTIRYVHTILSAALGAAVDSGRLARNPAATAHPPTARQAKAPEMRAWTTA